MNPEIIHLALQMFFPTILLAVIVAIAAWIRSVEVKSRRNKIEEIDLLAKKVSLDIQSKPIDSLVRESNVEHSAVSDVVSPAGDNIKKK